MKANAINSFLILLVSGLIVAPFLQAQTVGNYLGNEDLLYAETKQVNQFFRRFNSEEDKNGKRIRKSNPNFRDPDRRKQYIRILFDGENDQISEARKDKFIGEVCFGKEPKFLDFHAGEWFAEVQAFFEYYGKEREVTLFLRLEQAGLGYKWVLSNVYFEPFYKAFESDTTDGKKFLHPLSHELDFMNLVKAFRNVEEVQEYTSAEYQPDFLTILLYEIKRGNMSFQTVSEVKFHFFQIDNWYFELQEFNRDSFNSGWLIANLININQQEKEMLMRYIYREE